MASQKALQYAGWTAHYHPPLIQLQRVQVQEESNLTAGAHRAVVASGGDHDLGLEHVGVHAHLRVVVQGHKGPVGDSSAHILAAHLILAHDQILDGCCVEQLDVGRLHTHRQVLYSGGLCILARMVPSGEG